MQGKQKGERGRSIEISKGQSIGEQASKPRTPTSLDGSQMRHSTGEASNDRGGKDVGLVDSE